ncbi:hypothetical protein HAX54_009061 [Datura stramonium]|uniref:Uncharacterized protein n=1 Tax=Datura stramonium TaxID=4076 RepID=A0ABS8TEA6_DATST|nr:hypothetical protein [Datura stramonium]
MPPSMMTVYNSFSMDLDRSVRDTNDCVVAWTFMPKTPVSGNVLWIGRSAMTKKRASSSTSQSKALVGRSAGHGTTHRGSQAGANQTWAQADPQLEVVNGG